jgi:hypothetical protein
MLRQAGAGLKVRLERLRQAVEWHAFRQKGADVRKQPALRIPEPLCNACAHDSDTTSMMLRGEPVITCVILKPAAFTGAGTQPKSAACAKQNHHVYYDIGYFNSEGTAPAPPA